MPQHDLSTKVFVFIACNDKEYEKYILKIGENEERGKTTVAGQESHQGFQWRFDAKTKLLRLIINKGSLGPRGWARLRPAKTDEDFQDTMRLPVLLDKLRVGQLNADDNVKYETKLAIKDVFVNKSNKNIEDNNKYISNFVN